MTTARQAILAASTAVDGSTAREHVASLAPGISTGLLELDIGTDTLALDIQSITADLRTDTLSADVTSAELSADLELEP